MAMMGLAIGGALALAKDELIDQPMANKKRQYEAATAAYSPWTHMQSEYVQDPNPIGQMLQYGAGGAAMGAAIQNANANTALQKSLASNPAISGATNLSTAAPDTALGGGQMSNQIGENSNALKGNLFDMSSSSPPINDVSNPFYGNNTGSGPQPSWSSPTNPSWRSLLASGQSLTNPEDQWQINPFNPSAWGQPGYSSWGK